MQRQNERGILDAMIHWLAKDQQAVLLDAFKSLLVTIVIGSPAAVVLCILSVGVLLFPLGVSPTEFVLSSAGTAVGPLALLQVKLILLYGFVFILCLVPCSDWVGASTSHLVARLCARIWEGARLSLSAASGMSGLPHPASRFGFWFAYWRRTEIWLVPFLPGDRPQLE